MKYHLFPDTELTISQLCFGCWGVISDSHWGDRKEDDSIEAMHAAIEAGVNFFDTAPMYGNGASELLLGKFLAEHMLRDKVVIASKVPPNKMNAAEVQLECEKSLERLQTDYIDLYQTHWTSREVPLTETWGAMRDLQTQGKVRYIGVCNAGVGDLSEILAPAKPLTNQLPYNLVWRMIEDRILPACVQNQIGILVYSPLMHGILADNYQSAEQVPDGRARTRHFSSKRPQTRHSEAGCETELFQALDRIRTIANRVDRPMAEIALAWIVQQSGIVSVIAGARNAQQLSDNVSFLERPLELQTLNELNAATEQLKSLLGSNPDMWDGGSNSRYR
ncbi:MAG: aldo/keto reductase [Planctomycetales bacterium]|nr:aldo/keto reductase [Planctomycetales bacterium]